MVAAAAERARRVRRTSSMVLLDDVGYAQFGCYGSDIATPTFDRLAAGGLRYAQLPHHRAVLADAGLPAHRPQPPLQRHGPRRRARRRLPRLQRARSRRRTGSSPRSSLRRGLRHVRRRQVAPRPGDGDGARAAAATRWPLGRGFERFYGFLGGETDQYHPDLVHDNHQIDPPAHAGGGLPPHRGPGRPGHRLPRRTCAPSSPDQPFFLCFTPGACHAPHQAPAEYIEPLPRAASTRAGTRGARRCSPASWPVGPAARRAPSCRERPSWVAGVGLADATTSAGCTPG